MRRRTEQNQLVTYFFLAGRLPMDRDLPVCLRKRFELRNLQYLKLCIGWNESFAKVSRKQSADSAPTYACFGTTTPSAPSFVSSHTPRISLPSPVVPRIYASHYSPYVPQESQRNTFPSVTKTSFPRFRTLSITVFGRICFAPGYPEHNFFELKAAALKKRICPSLSYSFEPKIKEMDHDRWCLQATKKRCSQQSQRTCLVE